MRKMLALCLILLLLLTAACARKRDEENTENLQIYYAVSGREQAEKGMLGAEDALLSGEGAAVEQLLAVLFADPKSEELVSPYPEGTRLRGYSLNGRNISLELSEEYGELSGLRETIADYCIVFTLSQLEDIETVSIYVENGDDKLSLSREDVLIRQD